MCACTQAQGLQCGGMEPTLLPEDDEARREHFNQRRVPHRLRTLRLRNSRGIQPDAGWIFKPIRGASQIL